MIKWNKKKLDILYECWKNGNDTKERLGLIEKNMPKVPSLSALKVMRKMAKTDPKWLKWKTRQKNLKEKEKLEKQKEREKKRKEKEQRRKDREEKRKIREEKLKQKKQIEKVSKNLNQSEIKEKIQTEFFFCPDTNQYVSNISCIFRIFGELSFGNVCDKCKRMNKYLPIIQEGIDGETEKNKRKRVKKHSSSEGSEAETENSISRKSKAGGAKSDTKC